MFVRNNTPFASKNYHVLSADYNAPDAPTDAIPAQTMTETICIDILETCETLDQFTQEARRLLEDGGYRLLE
jgi:hypothetical protein